MAEHFPGFSSSRILFRIILISSMIGICLSWMEVPNVHAKSRFLISRNTLDHLKREGLPEKLVQSMEPLMEKVYPDRETFFTALAAFAALASAKAFFASKAKSFIIFSISFSLSFLSGVVP